MSGLTCLVFICHRGHDPTLPDDGSAVRIHGFILYQVNWGKNRRESERAKEKQHS